MNGKDNIIQRILSDADSKCNAILDAAKARAEHTLQEAEEAIQKEAAAYTEKADVAASELLRNKLASAQLDARKYKLLCRQNLIADCYRNALEKLCGANDGERLEFIGKLISLYAEQGETVCVSKRDMPLVTQSYLDGINLSLVLSKEPIDICGGVVLLGNGYEKDVSLSKVVEYSRNCTESTVSSVLFGD